MKTNSHKHNFIDRDDSYSNSANNDRSNNIIANKRWKRRKKRNKNKISYKNSKCDNNNSQLNSIHSESESTNLEKNNYSDNEEINKNGNIDKSVMNDNDATGKSINNNNSNNKNYTYSETLYDVAEMDPWKDDRCRDFIALNVIQRLRSYHLPRNVTEMPPFAPINALRARNLIILPRALPDYRPCMGETPLWETNIETENDNNKSNNNPIEEVCNCSTELLEPHKEKLTSSPISSFHCISKWNENEAFAKPALPSSELHNTDLSSNSVETKIEKCLNDNFNSLLNDFTHNQVKDSSESIKKESFVNDNADHANKTERDNIWLQPPPPLLPCLEFSTPTTHIKTAHISNESICAIERARVLFYGPNGPLMTSTSPVASSGNKMTASSLSRSAESTSLSQSYRLSERFANTPKHDVSQLNKETEVQSTTTTEIKGKDDECIKLPETSVVMNEHENANVISKTEPCITNSKQEITSTTIVGTPSKVENKSDNEETESPETIKSIEEGRSIKQEHFEEEELNNEWRKNEELVKAINENALVENINITKNNDDDDEDSDDYKTDTIDIKEFDVNSKKEEDEDEILIYNSCSQTELKSTPQRSNSMTNVETAEVSTSLFCTPLPTTPEHGHYNEQNNKVTMNSNNNNNGIKHESNEIELTESVKSDNGKYNIDINETSPLPRVAQKSATYKHNMIETTSADMNDHDNLDTTSCAACNVLIDYFQSLLTRGVVLDRFSHKDLGFAWWVLGKDMNTNSLPQSALSRSPSSQLSTHASRRSKSNTINSNYNSAISMSAKRESSTTSQTHSAPSFPVGREKLLIMHRNLYYTLLTNESTRAKQIEQMHSATENKASKSKLNQELEDVNSTTSTNNKERLQIKSVEQKIVVNENKSKKDKNNNNLQSDKLKLSRQIKEKAKKQSLQALKKMQRTAKRTRYIVEELTVESSSSSSSEEECEEEQEELTERKEEELESQEQMEIDDEIEQQRQELEEEDDEEKQSNLLLSRRQARKHMTKNAKLAAAKLNKKRKMRRDNWREEESNNNFLTAVELGDEGICNKTKEWELELSQERQSQENFVSLEEEEQTINTINKKKTVMNEEFEVGDVNNTEECQSENAEIEEIHESEVATVVEHENNQGRKWKRRRSSWFDKSRRVISNDAVRQKRRREKANAVATDENLHDKSETVDATTKANATVEKLEVLLDKDIKDEKGEEQEEEPQRLERIIRKDILISRREERKQIEEEEEEAEKEKEEEYEHEEREKENLAIRRSKIFSEVSKKRVSRHNNDEANVKSDVRAETSKPSSSPSASYTAEGVIDSTKISPYETWLNEHITRQTILKFVREHHISRYNNLNHSDMTHSISSHNNKQQMEHNVKDVFTDADHYSIADREHKINLVNINDVIKCNTAERINKRLRNSSTPYSFLLASECQSRKRGDFLSLLCASAENTHEDTSRHEEREEEVDDTVHDMQHHADSSNIVDKGMDLELLHSMKRYEQWEAEHLLMQECKTEHDAKEVTNIIENTDDISTTEVKDNIDHAKNVPVEENVENDDELYKDAEIKDHLPFSQLPFAQKCLLIWHCSNCLDTYARRRAERNAEWKEAHHKRGVRTRGMILRSHSGKAEKPDVIAEHDNASSSNKEETSIAPIDEADEMLESRENEMPDELILESSLDENEEDEEEEEEEEEVESKDELEIEQKIRTEIMDKAAANKKNVCKEELPLMAKNRSLINPSQQTFADVVLVKNANSVVPTSTLLQSRPEFDYWKEVNEKETQVENEKPTQM